MKATVSLESRRGCFCSLCTWPVPTRRACTCVLVVHHSGASPTAAFILTFQICPSARYPSLNSLPSYVSKYKLEVEKDRQQSQRGGGEVWKKKWFQRLWLNVISYLRLFGQALTLLVRYRMLVYRFNTNILTGRKPPHWTNGRSREKFMERYTLRCWCSLLGMGMGGGGRKQAKIGHK